ncbi:hypothetical protein C4577_03490 [Candidatus Parcubacteria bacterium]|nr:MAG: hypothetical protein C4577_03490 [Candidatus Parcubacteria bacterium]
MNEIIDKSENIRALMETLKQLEADCFPSAPSYEKVIKIQEEWINRFVGPGFYVSSPGAKIEKIGEVKEMNYGSSEEPDCNLPQGRCSCDGKTSMCIICAMEMRDRAKGITTSAKRNPFYKYE